jgi:hypothetical protein
MNEESRVSDLVDNFQRRGLYGFDRSKVEQALPVPPPQSGSHWSVLPQKDA